jgi:hypothetical protein
MPGVRSRRAKGGSREPFFAAANQVDSVLSADGRRPERLPTEYRSVGVDVKRNAVQLRCSMTNVDVHERIINSNLLVPHKALRDRVAHCLAIFEQFCPRRETRGYMTFSVRHIFAHWKM